MSLPAIDREVAKLPRPPQASAETDEAPSEIVKQDTTAADVPLPQTLVRIPTQPQPLQTDSKHSAYDRADGD
jgi:hypothetical protein